MSTQGIKPRPLQVPIHSQKCEIKPVKVNLGRGEEERYVVSMSLTLGELVALRGATSAPRNPVAADVSAYVRNALERIGIRI
jgi:hypothetical protein